MYISLDWISELVSLETVNLEDLIEKLTLGGFEVEEILELEINNKKRIVLDISATANRADSLSIKGIAKEIIALIEKSVISLNYTTQSFVPVELNKNNFELTDETIGCSNFIALSIQNLTNSAVPKWLTEKLLSSGITPVNNLLDFQTYILLETGYPFEFYDLKKIQNLIGKNDFNFTLNSKNSNNSFLASNDLEYNLVPNLLTIEVNNLPISIAGIIESKATAYSSQTTSLLIEGSIFHSKKIRKQSRIVGLRTDRSARYEKGLNNSYFVESLIRLVSLLRITNPKLTVKVHTASQIRQKDREKIVLNYDRVIEILGPVREKITAEPVQLLPDQISSYLNRLNFGVSFDSKALSWVVEVPADRSDDIEREIDLIEEIGRLHGFNEFLTKLPKIERIGAEDFSYQTRKKITNCFLNEGFSELMQYSLVNDPNPKTIRLVNPLITDCSTLRRSLLPSLIKIISENSKQGNPPFEGFEYGHVFSGDIKTKYLEKECVSGIFGGVKLKRQWSDIPVTLSWYEGKGKIEEIFKKLNISVIWKNSTVEFYKDVLHPYRTAELYLLNGVYLGIFGQINPIIAKKEDVSSELYLFEFNLELLKEELQNTKLPIYKEYSLYPKITKDLSFVIDRAVSFDQLQMTLLRNGGDFLISVRLLDEYQGKSIPEDKTSLCIQLTYQSTEKTLLTKDVEKSISCLQDILEKDYSVITRA